MALALQLCASSTTREVTTQTCELAEEPPGALSGRSTSAGRQGGLAPLLQCSIYVLSGAHLDEEEAAHGHHHAQSHVLQYLHHNAKACSILLSHITGFAAIYAFGLLSYPSLPDPPPPPERVGWFRAEVVDACGFPPPYYYRYWKIYLFMPPRAQHHCLTNACVHDEGCRKNALLHFSSSRERVCALRDTRPPSTRIRFRF